MKMKGAMLGCHLLDKCPRWVPASSNSFSFGKFTEWCSMSVYRLLNWNLLLAFLRPYFLRSTILGSLARNPCFFNSGRCVGATLHSARAIPSLIASACPLKPPPVTLTRMSYCLVAATWSSGCLTSRWILLVEK